MTRHIVDDAPNERVFSDDDERWMLRAIALAAEGEAVGEVPVGAVIVDNDKVIGEGYNCPISRQDPSAHAEIVALRAAAELRGNYRLSAGATLYVTLEPCVMCVGAILQARVSRLIYGAREHKFGAVESAFELLHAPQHFHRIKSLGGCLEPQCRQQIQRFFAARRAQKKS